MLAKIAREVSQLTFKESQARDFLHRQPFAEVLDDTSQICFRRVLVYDRNGVAVLGESSPMRALRTDGLFRNFRNLDLGEYDDVFCHY